MTDTLSTDIPAVPRGGITLRPWRGLEDIPGMRRAGTGGWAGLANCFFWIDRAAGIGGVLMTQILPFFDARVIERTAELERAAYAGVPVR